MRMCPACGVRFTNEAAFCPHDGGPTEDVEEQGESVDPLIGQVLDGRYRIEQMIGEGGMGVVYRAMHEGLAKPMAIKVLRGDAAKDPDIVQRFVQEAQTSSTIGHPNIISISDFGRMPDGTAYFVMEYLEGETLADHMRREAPLGPRRTARILRGIGSAMAAAHARGVVHRDLKPDNVFLAQLGDPDPVVKVLDFGIAKVGGAHNKLTRTGVIFGTPYYIAPEQAAGQAVDARTDIYAMGVIAYELATGRVPFEGETFMGILGKHMFEPPTPPAQLAGSAGVLEPLILRALAKKPEERYSSVDAMLEDLNQRIEAEAPGFSGEYQSQGVVMAAAEARAGAADVGSDAGTTSGRPAEDIVLRTGRGPLYALAAATALVAIAAVAGIMYSYSGPATQASASVTVTPEAPGTDATPAPNPDTPAEAAPAVHADASSGASVARIHIESHPEGASVYEEDVLLGNTPVDLPVPETPRVLTLRLRGRGDAQVRLSADGPTSLVVELPAARRPHPGRPAATPAAVSPMALDMTAVMRRPPQMRQRPHPTVQSTEVVDPWATE